MQLREEERCLIQVSLGAMRSTRAFFLSHFIGTSSRRKESGNFMGGGEIGWLLFSFEYVFFLDAIASSSSYPCGGGGG